MTFVQNTFRPVNERDGDCRQSLQGKIAVGAVHGWSGSSRAKRCLARPFRSTRRERLTRTAQSIGRSCDRIRGRASRLSFSSRSVAFSRWSAKNTSGGSTLDESTPKYVVLGSRVPAVYNLGGDLALFSECIRAADRQALQSYADLCIEVVYNAAVSLHSAGHHYCSCSGRCPWRRISRAALAVQSHYCRKEREVWFAGKLCSICFQVWELTTSCPADLMLRGRRR